jgi:RimK family alpha-L-glutamate ligase
MTESNFAQYAIIGPTSNGKMTQLLFNSFKKRGIDVSHIIPSENGFANSKIDRLDFIGKQVLKIPDIALVRGVGSKVPSKIFFRLDWMSMLEHMGIRLVNSRRCLEIATNKMLTTQALIKYNVMTPSTYMCENYDLAFQSFRDLGGDVVLKPLYGARGKGIIRLTNEYEAQYIFRKMEENDEIFYLQKYIEHNFEDIRILVVGGQAICGMKRKSNSWLTNLAQGGKAFSFKMPEEYQELGIKSAEAVGGEIVGVDLMDTKDGIMVIEVNAVPGFQGLQSVCEFDISDRIIDYVLSLRK